MGEGELCQRVRDKAGEQRLGNGQANPISNLRTSSAKLVTKGVGLSDGFLGEVEKQLARTCER
jgi:hypothetical protein